MDENKIKRFLKEAQSGWEKMDGYCAKITHEIEPHLPSMDEYEEFGVQFTTDGFCCYFDEMIVPIKDLVALLNEEREIDFVDIKRIAI